MLFCRKQFSNTWVRLKKKSKIFFGLCVPHITIDKQRASNLYLLEVVRLVLLIIFFLQLEYRGTSTKYTRVYWKMNTTTQLQSFDCSFNSQGNQIYSLGWQVMINFSSVSNLLGSWNLWGYLTVSSPYLCRSSRLSMILEYSIID